MRAAPRQSLPPVQAAHAHEQQLLQDAVAERDHEIAVLRFKLEQAERANAGWEAERARLLADAKQLHHETATESRERHAL